MSKNQSAENSLHAETELFSKGAVLQQKMQHITLYKYKPL